MKVDQIITEDEAALYDRQIRLWGVEAQKKLLSSRILLINMTGLAAEISKNLVLSGLNCLTLLDSNEVTEVDPKFNFLLSRSSIGKNRAESCVDELIRLNPMVKVVADKGTIEEKDEAYFSKDNFDLVCALIDDIGHLTKINEMCRKNNVLFLAGVVTGLYGCMFVDFNDYQFIVETPEIAEETTEKTKSTEVKSIKTENKLAFEEKNIKFKSYKEFLDSFHIPIENLTPKKLKRLPKNYFLNLIFNKFYESYQRSYDPLLEEDKQHLIDLKNSLFDKYKLDRDFLPDSYFNEKKFETNAGTVSVNAILGGTIGQEIIKAISKKNEPIENYFLFDGETMGGEVMRI